MPAATFVCLLCPFLRLQELQRAVLLSPDVGFEKYMYLGQLLEGEEALAATQKGVELLQQVRREQLL